MITVKSDSESFIVVDFEGVLSKCEEEVAAYKMTGKNNQAVAQILGKSPETVHKQLSKSYSKLDLTGTDNPLAALQLLSFKKGWVRFTAALLMIFSLGLPTRSNLTRVNSLSARSGREHQLFSVA